MSSCHPHPIALTDAQLNVLIDYAQQVPPQWRSRYLEAVVDQLLPLQHDVTNDDIQDAIRRTLNRFGCCNGCCCET
jgi:hypothetical protein